MAGENPASTTEYIQHHLQNLVYGNHPESGWGFAQGAQEAAEMGFLGISRRLSCLVIGPWDLVLLVISLCS